MPAAFENHSCHAVLRIDRAGKPCIRGMRITVRRVLELLASYSDRAALIVDYPFLEPEDLNQALRFAAASVDDESLGIDRVA